MLQRGENIWENWSAAKKSELIHDYIMRYYDRNMRKLDYGTGECYTAVEVHILEKIFLHPGITVTQVATLTSRTKGAISQIVTKLCDKGLVVRKAQTGGEGEEPAGAQGKKRSLWLTEKGKELNQLHMTYDESNAKMFFDEVSQYYTSEQMDAFFKIMETCFHLLDPNGSYPWSRDQ